MLPSASASLEKSDSNSDDYQKDGAGGRDNGGRMVRPREGALLSVRTQRRALSVPTDEGDGGEGVPWAINLRAKTAVAAGVRMLVGLGDG